MAKIEIARKEDLDGLATKTELEQVMDSVDLKSDKDHTHSWSEITDKPSIPDTSGLATKEEVNGKADSGHTHSYNDLSDKPTIPSIDGLASQAGLDALQSEVTTLQDLVETLQDEIEALKGESEPEE